MNRTVALTLLATLPVALADPAPGDGGPPPRVSICHATHSASTPSVLITVGGPAERAHERHQDGEDVSSRRDLNLRSGPADAQTCREDAGGPNPT